MRTFATSAIRSLLGYGQRTHIFRPLVGGDPHYVSACPTIADGCCARKCGGVSIWFDFGQNEHRNTTPSCRNTAALREK